MLCLNSICLLKSGPQHPALMISRVLLFSKRDKRKHLVTLWLFFAYSRVRNKHTGGNKRTGEIFPSKTINVQVGILTLHTFLNLQQ